MFYDCFFFFSSRRRHTRFDCDWSSDVCSSDLALGAGRLRLIRQLVVESVLLAGAGGVGGLMLARWGLRMIVSLVPKHNLVETESVHHISMNVTAFAFTAALSLLTGAAGLVSRRCCGGVP